MEKSGIQPFSCYTDPATLGPRWTRWLTSFELYADGKGLILTGDITDAIKQRRRALLLHLAGQDVQDIFSTLPRTGEAKDYAAAVAALNTYFVPQVNAAYARQTFLKLSQKQGETVQQFCTRLRQAAKDCDFRGDNDNQIRDAILGKCTSEYVRRKLLEDIPGLTLARTLEVAAQCERVEEQLAAMSVTGEKKEGDTVSRISTTKKEKYPKPKGKVKEENKRDRQCYRCGFTDHMGKDPKCPARGQTCHKCGGYARVVLALISFYLMPCCPWPAVFCYLLSALLDAFDGHAARALNQSTKFGAMMDMLTDRCATMCLLVNLSLLYPSYTFLFQLSMCLDIASHWLHLHSSTIKGSASHKTIDLSGNPILRLYYTSKPVLFVMCAGNELFFCLLYILYHIEEPAGWLYWLQGLCGIICLLKSGISLLHLVTASQNMAAMDAAEREKAAKTK